MKEQAITRNLMNVAFKKLAEKLQEANVHCEICVYGGGAMVYAYRLRGMSMDLDYRIVSIKDSNKPEKMRESDILISIVRNAIRSVGEELGFDDDWMNDGVKGFISMMETFDTGRVFHGEKRTIVPALKVVFPSPEYLFAMKCLAMRNNVESPHDKSDIIALAKVLGISDSDSALDVVTHFYPERIIPQKTFYGLSELFDSEPMMDPEKEGFDEPMF